MEDEVVKTEVLDTGALLTIYKDYTGHEYGIVQTQDGEEYGEEEYYRLMARYL